MRSSPSTVRQLTVAAMLGAIPTIGRAQQSRVNRDTSARSSKGVSDSSSDVVRVATRTIARGAVLTAEDIAYSNTVPAPSHAVPHSVAALDTAQIPAATNDMMIGWIARRVITAGQVLKAPAVAAPTLVKSGDMVELMWKQGSVIVTAKGRATKSASAGERVTVKLSASQAVEGSVVASGRVRVE